MALEEVFLSSGQKIMAHVRGDCRGEYCAIHKPSPHDMVTWPLAWREDKGILERMCEHGIGHPDPDSLAFIKLTRGDKEATEYGVHGCDGCCKKKPWSPASDRMTT